MERITKAIEAIMLILLLMGMMTMAFHFEPIKAESSSQQCRQGMISYWKFDEGEGITAYDSADANDGDIIGATWTTGMVEGALSFDGESDSVDVGAGTNLDITGAITVEAWIKPEALAGRNPIFARWNDVGAHRRQYFIEIKGGRIAFHICQDGTDGSIDFVQGNTTLSVGKWHHVAGVYNSSYLEVYLNGSSDGSKTTSLTSIFSYSQDAFIGYGKVNEAYNFFNGTIDEVAINNKALTPEEIQQHYDNGLIGRGYCGVDWWPMFHHDLRHSGYSTTEAPSTNNVLWNYTTGGGVISSPSVVDDRIYVGSDDHKVYCINAITGTHIWNYTTDYTITSSPAIVDGRVYVGSDDNNIYCLNETTGVKLWNYTTGNDVESSPAVANGRVYVGSADHRLYCLNASTGTYIWDYYTWLEPILSSPAVVDGRVFFGSWDRRVYCVNSSNGSSIWGSGSLGDIISSSPAVVDGRVYVGSNNDRLYCLNASTGAFIWNYTTNGDVTSSPAVANGRVYVGSWDKNVYCLNTSDGTLIWNYTTGNWVDSSPAVADGKVYVGSVDHRVYCLNASTGIYIWNYKTDGDVWSSPAIADGKVYVGSEDGQIYCFAPYPTGPEFAVQQLKFDPESPVPVETNVSITAEIQNYGICWAELWHGHTVLPPNDNNEWMEFYFTQNSPKKERLSLRARNNGTNARVNIWINETGLMGEELVRHAEFIINSTSWTTYEFMGTLNITAGEHRVRINLVNGEMSEVDIDWLKIGNLHIEAETYVDMGGNDIDPDNRGVDKITPGNVIVDFYDVTPTSQVKINGDVLIGDINYINPNNTLLKYVKNGGTTHAEVNWTAYPAGDHNITVDVRHDTNPRSHMTKVLRVTATLQINRNCTGPECWCRCFIPGTTDPKPGSYIYPYGDTYQPPSVKITVIAIPFYPFEVLTWKLDGQATSGSSTITVTLDKNRQLEVLFNAEIRGLRPGRGAGRDKMMLDIGET